VNTPRGVDARTVLPWLHCRFRPRLGKLAFSAIAQGFVRPTILLFDIDGTLITTGGVGRRAIERAFDERYGRSDACTSFRFDGMTDRLIARQALTILGVEPTEAAIDDILAVYVRLLEVEVARADAAKYRLHTGIAEALAVAREHGMGIGLGTGNVRDGARIKLSRVAIRRKTSLRRGASAPNRSAWERVDSPPRRFARRARRTRFRRSRSRAPSTECSVDSGAPST